MDTVIVQKKAGIGKYIFWGVAAAAAVYGGSILWKGLQTQKAGKLINILIKKAQIHKFDINGLDLWIDITLQNPSLIPVVITQPYVRLVSKESSTIASSPVSNSQFTLNPLSDTPINTIKLLIGPVQLLAFLSKVNYQFPPEADTIIKKITYLAGSMATTLSALELSVISSTYANGFYYESVQKLAV